jgi:hypothetical protein
VAFTEGVQAVFEASSPFEWAKMQSGSAPSKALRTALETSEGGIAAFCRGYLGHRFASTKQAVAMTGAFKKSIATLIEKEDIELVHFTSKATQFQREKHQCRG